MAIVAELCVTDEHKRMPAAAARPAIGPRFRYQKVPFNSDSLSVLPRWIQKFAPRAGLTVVIAPEQSVIHFVTVKIGYLLWTLTKFTDFLHLKVRLQIRFFFFGVLKILTCSELVSLFMSTTPPFPVFRAPSTVNTGQQYEYVAFKGI